MIAQVTLNIATLNLLASRKTIRKITFPPILFLLLSINFQVVTRIFYDVYANLIVYDADHAKHSEAY